MPSKKESIWRFLLEEMERCTITTWNELVRVSRNRFNTNPTTLCDVDTLKKLFPKDAEGKRNTPDRDFLLQCLHVTEETGVYVRYELTLCFSEARALADWVSESESGANKLKHGSRAWTSLLSVLDECGYLNEWNSFRFQTRAILEKFQSTRFCVVSDSVLFGEIHDRFEVFDEAAYTLVAKDAWLTGLREQLAPRTKNGEPENPPPCVIVSDLTVGPASTDTPLSVIPSPLSSFPAKELGVDKHTLENLPPNNTPLEVPPIATVDIAQLLLLAGRTVVQLETRCVALRDECEALKRLVDLLSRIQTIHEQISDVERHACQALGRLAVA